MRESNERPVTAASTVAEAEIGGNRLELGLSSSAIILVWRSHTHEREARGSGVMLDCDLYPAAGILQSNQISELPYYVT